MMGGYFSLQINSSDQFVLWGITRRDNANGSGDCFSRDGMVTGHHDNSNTGRTTQADGVWNSGTGRIDHGHQANESQVFDGKVDVFYVTLETNWEICRWQLVVAETYNRIKY